MGVDRRTFLASMAAAAAVGANASAAPRDFGQSGSTGHPIVGKRPKNVILMICDDLGYEDIRCYGGALPTPNLDRLASDGMRFTQFNAAHPLCSASRASLLTGRYAVRSHTPGVYFPQAQSGMARDETTIAQLFKARGYRTKAIGKWHLGDAPEYLPTSRGFDSYLGVPYSVDMKPLPMIRDLQVLEADTDRHMLTPRYTEEAVRFLGEVGDDPFFMYLAYSYPHDPARASPRFQNHSSFGSYGDSVEEIDWSVGEILRVLESKGLSQDTLVLFTSDHGPWFQGSPGGLRGRKGSTFEGGCRVPLIVRYPGAVPSGVVSNALTSNLDVLPTLAALCDLELPAKPLDGIDISSLLFGAQPDLARPPLLYFTPFSPQREAGFIHGGAGGGVDVHCLRHGEWKLRVAQLTGEIYIVDYTIGHESYWLPRPELYNVVADPGECYDVAREHGDVVRSLLGLLSERVKTFAPEVISAFEALRGHVADLPTRPGESPLRPGGPQRSWAWVPPDRRRVGL